MKSTKQARKKYNIAKITNYFDNFHCKMTSNLTDNSSKEYCWHIYQIEALANIFLLNIVSYSGFVAIFGLRGPVIILTSIEIMMSMIVMMMVIKLTITMMIMVIMMIIKLSCCWHYQQL